MISSNAAVPLGRESRVPLSPRRTPHTNATTMMGSRLRNAYALGEFRNLAGFLLLSYLADTRVNISRKPS